MATMNPGAAGGIPYRVPPEPSKVPSIILAIVVHAGLLLFLWSGIRWQNTEPIAVEAEVWDMNIKSAAAPPQPVPEPPRPPEPEPEPVKRAPPPPVAQAVPVKQPDIALERIKEQKLKQQQLEKQAEERLIKEQEKKKAEELEKKKLAEQEAAEKKAAEKAKKLAEAKAAAKEKDALNKIIADDRKRIMGALGESGDAQKSTGPKGDPSYYAAIAAKIRSRLVYAGNTDVPGDPVAEFQIDQLPTGEIMSVRMTKSSGIPAYDAAIRSAIDESSPLPKKKDGTVQKSVPAAFRLKEKR